MQHYIFIGTSSTSLSVAEFIIAVDGPYQIIA